MCVCVCICVCVCVWVGVRVGVGACVGRTFFCALWTATPVISLKCCLRSDLSGLFLKAPPFDTSIKALTNSYIYIYLGKSLGSLLIVLP